MFEDAWLDASGQDRGRFARRARLVRRTAADLLTQAVLMRRDALLGDPRPALGRHRSGELHQSGGLDRVADLVRDTHYAARSLIRRPAVLSVALISLSLGSAVTVAVLSLAHALVVAPLDVDTERVYWVDETRQGSRSIPLGIDAIPYSRFQSYEDAVTPHFRAFAGDQFWTFSLASDQGAVSVTGYLVTSSYFALLGLTPTVGRFIRSDDETSVVLGFDVWQQRYGGDPGVVGRSIQIDSRPFTVVGVAPRDFHGTTHGLRSDLWIPIEAYGFDPEEEFDWLTVFGRLRPDVPLDVASAAIDALAQATPGPRATVRGAALVPLTGVPPDDRGLIVRFLTLLVATGLIVLLIASANVAGVLMTRGVSRSREVAIRRALGASRGRVTRLLLTETVLLFGVCGAVGLPLGALSLLLLERLSLPVGFDVAFDLAAEPGVLAVAMGIAAATGLAFGLVPALQASGRPVAPSLKQTTRGGSRHAGGWRLFVGGQIALSVLLLVAAGVSTRSVLNARDLDLGFDPADVVIGQVYLGPHGYFEEEGRALHRRMVDEILALPEVAAAGWSDGVLLGSSYGRYSTSVRAVPEDPDGDATSLAGVSYVDAGYLQSIRVPIRLGRGIEDGDRSGAPWVAVINQTLAERLWPGESALGHAVRSSGRDYEVVGVTGPGRYSSVAESESSFLFLSASQHYRQRMTLHVRSTLPPGETLGHMRRILLSIDPNIALRGPQRLTAAVGVTLFPQRFAATMIGLFGAIGLIFAATGIYGVMSFHVAQRTREIGVRVALGGRPTELILRIVRDGTSLAAVAVAVGFGAAALMSPLLQSLVIGVRPLDPATYGAVGILLVAVAAFGSFVPARRAARVDPVEALRSE